MATTDTGDLGTLTLVSVSVVDPDSTGEKYIKVTYTLDSTGATDTLDGFLIWHDDEAGSTTPVWVNACDASLAGGGDHGDPATYEVLVPVPLATSGAIWWEGFEEYADGAITGSDMSGGGKLWSGAWSDNNYTIISRTIASETDKRCSISTSSNPLARLMSVGNTWTKIRIGVRFSITTPASFAAPRPAFWFGLTAGQTGLPGSATINHFFGCHTTSRLWANATASVSGGIDSIAIETTASRVQSGSESTSNFPAANSFDTAFYRATAGRCAWIIDIEKGSPYKLTLYASGAGHNVDSTAEVTPAEFRGYMDGTLAIPGVGDTGNQRFRQQAAEKTFTVDEATDGNLDTICAAYMGTDESVEISDIDYRVIS